MKIGMIVVVTVVAMSAVTGCERASSPTTVNKHVAEARADAQRQDNKALADAAVTEAKGRHEIAIQRCNGLAGDQQKACKDQADAAYELAKANANAQKVATDNGNTP